MNWNEIKQKQLKLSMPLYDIEWSKEYVINKIKKEDECYQSKSDYNEYFANICKRIHEFTGFVIGKIEREDWYPSFALGFKEKCGYLDDGSYIEYLTNDLFKPLIDAELFDPRLMESYAGVVPGEVSEKELLDVVSTVLGNSLSDPKVPKSDINTAFLKTYLNSLYSCGEKNIKRKSKSKLGKLNIREFLCGERESTVIDYEGRVICEYSFFDER